MIYFINASRSNLYPKPQKASKKVVINYLFPESTLTEIEQVEFVDYTVAEYYALYKPLKYSMTVFSNSIIVMTQFRVLIKESKLNLDDFKIVYYTYEGTKRVVHTPILDEDGRFDIRPENFFDNYSIQLRRLM